MNKQNRRAFLQASTVALAAGLGPVAALGGSVTADDLVSNLNAAQVAPTVPANEGRQPLRLGLILGIGRDPHDAIAKVHDLGFPTRSEEHTSELQSPCNLVCRLLLEKKIQNHLRCDLMYITADGPRFLRCVT